MRDIKFRVYDKQSKKYITLEEYQNLNAIEVENDGTLTLSPRYRFTMNMMICTDAFDVQQYTGLKDKNGKEIYEGDIVRYMAIADGEQIDKVIFDKGTFVVDYSEDYKQPVNEINHCAEVIGNIYENSNLLQEEN